MLRLEKVNGKNVWDILKLSVLDSQKSFVATNELSIIEAYCAITAKISKGNYNLWRLMIDKNYQHRGFGKEAVRLALDFIKTLPCRKAEYCWLSYEKENEIARDLYASFGFKETGEMDGDEIIAVLKL